MQQLFGGDYTLESGTIRDRNEEIVFSSQTPGTFLQYYEIGTHSLIFMRSRILLDLRTKVSRQISDSTVGFWINAYSNLEGTLLAIIGESNYGESTYAFYDLSGSEITKLESPELPVYTGGANDHEEDGSPSVIAFGEIQVEWRPDGCLVWKERRPYYIDMNMWHWEAENKIDSLFPFPSEICNPLDAEWHPIVDQRFTRMNEEKKEWRTYETIILKREGNKIIIVEKN